MRCRILHIMLPVIAIGILGVGIYSGAYMSEIFRSGINAVPKGQMESGMSQGFGYWKLCGILYCHKPKEQFFPPWAIKASELSKTHPFLL